MVRPATMPGPAPSNLRRIAPLILVAGAVLAFRACKGSEAPLSEHDQPGTNKPADSQGNLPPKHPAAAEKRGLEDAIAEAQNALSKQASSKKEASPTQSPRPSPSPGATLKLFDWNLENFSGIDHQKHWRDTQKDKSKSQHPRLADNRPPRRHNLAKIQALVAEQAPDIISFQEVIDKEAVIRLFGDYQWQFTRHGGRGQQFLALGYNKQSGVKCQALPDIEGLSARKTVRPGLRARCQSPAYPDFQVINVHLKASPKGSTLREHQWKVLFDLLRSSSQDTIIVGDWNFAGNGNIDGRRERERFRQRAQSQAQLYESELDLPCTSYWPGKERRDGKMETSVLDGYWLRGFGSPKKPPKTQVLGACRDQNCRPLKGDPGIPAPLRGLSDHCPLALHL